MAKRKPHLWVVEMLIDGRWEPTVGVFLNRDDARVGINIDWRVPNPDDKFRLRKYVRDDA